MSQRKTIASVTSSLLCAFSLTLFPGRSARAEHAPEPPFRHDVPATDRSSNDPIPIPPSPVVDNPGGITRQAGIGGTQAYARAGVLELGGSGGLQMSDGFTMVNFSPSIGWFVADNLELSAIIGLNYAKASGQDSRTFFKAVLEPSYHLPFTPVVFAFLGLGLGTAYSGSEFGFNLAPRLGANFLVGRSGILTPAFTVDYSTVNVVNTSQGTLLGVRTAYGLAIGYTVMW